MSQTMEEQVASPTPEEVIGKVNESISALQDAQKTVVEGAQLLARHVNDPNAHGASIPEVVEQHIPVPVMEGTSLQWQKQDGTPFGDAVDLKGEPGRDGIDGQDGTDGQDGQIGPRPDHRWEGTKLLIQNMDGSWPDEGVDLKGDKGDTGQVEGLSDAVDSDSSTTPASSKAVKTAYDKAVSAQNAANAADSKAQAAQSAADTAQAAAEAADAKAQTAQSTAQNAEAKAQEALTSAEAADSKAQAAQSAAEAAQAAADSAAAIADDAKAAAESAGEMATENSPGLVKASTTAAAGTVPLAGSDGSLDESWIPKPDAWNIFPPFVPIPVWGVTFGGSDGRRAILPGESAAREEWVKCDGGSDGKGGTVPDMAGRYVRGASDTEAEGTKGGSETFSATLSGSTGATTLTTNQMPSHTHPVSTPNNNTGDSYTGFSTTYGRTNSTRNTDSSGGSQSHTHPLSGTAEGSNLDPYIVMHYIMKVV